MDRTHWLIAGLGGANERVVPIHRRLVVGRACVGVTPDQRLVIDDPLVSRNHLEIVVAPTAGPEVIDLSTNGTRVNGSRIPRAQPIAINDATTIELGSTRLRFRTLAPSQPSEDALRATIHELEAGRLTLPADDPLGKLTEREREILALIAQGHSNSAIAARLVVSVRTVETHVRHIMTTLRLPETPDDNRRVHAVLTYLRATLANAPAA